MTIETIDQMPDKDWVAMLSVLGTEQTKALSELRQILFRRIQHAFRSNGKVDDAFVEDAVQDGLLAILKSLGDFEGRSQFTTWCTTITVRIAITELRRRRWKDVSLEGLMVDGSVDSALPVTDSDGQSDLQRSELIKTMRRVIAEELSDRQKTVLEAELKGMPQSEIGRCLGSTRNAIYKVGHDARKKLKQGMIAAGYSSEDLNIFKRTVQ